MSSDEEDDDANGSYGSIRTIPLEDDDSSDEEASMIIIKPSVPRLEKIRRSISKCCCGCCHALGITIYRIWFFTIFMSSLYLITMIPFQIAFLEKELYVWMGLEVLIDIVLLIDMFVSGFVPYHRKFNARGWKIPPCCKNCVTYTLTQPICDKCQCRGLCCDCFICFPFYGFAFAINPIIAASSSTSDVQILTTWLKLNRLLIALRLPTYFRQLNDYVVKSIFRINPAVTKVFMFLLLVALIAHYCACFFYLIVRIEGDEAAIEFAMSNNILSEDGSIIFKYSTSAYWALVTMTGYGGTLPITDLQVLYSLVIVFIGVVVYVTVIGISGSMITNLDTAATAYRNKVDTMNDYMKFRKLDKKTSKSIRRYYHYLWSTRKGMDEEKIMFNLPVFLRLEVSRCLNKDMLSNFLFFKESSDGFIRGILVRLIPKTVYPSSYIIKQGEIGKEMYFLTKGVVDIYVKGLPKAVATLSAVACFGESALLTGDKRNASIVARGFCDMFILKQKDFDEICDCYKEERERIWKIHNDRMAETEKEKKEKEKKEQEEEEIRKQQEQEEMRRRQKEEEKKRIERLKREKAIVFEKRKRRRKRKMQRRRKLQKQSANGSIRRRKDKLEIWAQTKEIM